MASSIAAFRSATALRYQSVLVMLKARYLGPRIGAVDPLQSFKSHPVEVLSSLVTILLMAALAHFTLQPVDYRGAALPFGRFRSVTPP